MDDSELFNLTVVELRSLCNEKGLEAAKLRKKQIVELLVDNGVSEIPEDLRNRGTPRKSVKTPVKSSIITRRSALTPQKNLFDANLPVPTSFTPRSARYQRSKQLDKLEETRKANKENEAEEVEAEQQRADAEKRKGMIKEVSHQEEKEEEYSDAREELPIGEDSGDAMEEPKNTSEESGDAAKKKEDSTEENEATVRGSGAAIEGKEEASETGGDGDNSNEDAGKDSEDGAKESEDAGSASSFTTAASPADSTLRVDKDDDEGSITPRKSRKRWETSTVSDFNFAREPEPSTGATTPNDENVCSPGSSSAVEADGSEPSPDSASMKDSPTRPRLTRQRTFTIETPASKSTPGVSKVSKVGFKASKTPNFKKIHERNQAKFEDIAEYSARRRDRMRQLVSTSRALRTGGTTPRDSVQTPKTPRRTVKAITKMETPASERKILSNKVRSNRRFELLMKARGLPVDGETPEDH